MFLRSEDESHLEIKNKRESKKTYMILRIKNSCVYAEDDTEFNSKKFT